MQELSPEYQRFLKSLPACNARSRVAGALLELDRLGSKIDRALDGRRNARSLADERRHANRVDRLEVSEARLIALLDEYPPEYVAEVSRTLNNHSRR